MKKIFTLIFALTLALNSVIANTVSLKIQLEDLNVNWKNNSDVLFSSDPVSKLDENGIIKTHLFLVENKLRGCPPQNLSAEQMLKRNYCLGILNDYWTNGVFPKNIYHENRTPYFIDKYGTACAVGQLIVSTGNLELAKRISKENNYGYIHDLVKVYPEIISWAEKNGFTIDELAWIQPGYAICDTVCGLAAVISTVSGTAPFTYQWSNGETTEYATSLCPATTYSCIVTDATGNIIPPAECNMSTSAMIIPGTNQITMPNAVPFYIDLTSTIDNGNCNGTASVEVLNGAPPFDFHWSPGGQIYSTATDLCGGIYYVTVMDANTCVRFDSVEVLSSVGISELNKSKINIYPNPVSNVLFLQSENAFRENSIVQIYNALNQIVIVRKLSGHFSEIDVSELEKGTYTVSIQNESEVDRRRFIKN